MLPVLSRACRFAFAVACEVSEDGGDDHNESTATLALPSSADASN
jgi:hypothetical protein